MKTAYFDQNMWIQIAQVWHGKVRDPARLHAVDALRDAVETQRWAAPLSAVHYQEVARRGTSGSRARLAEVMWSLSGGRTIAGYSDIVRHEIRQGLSDVLAEIDPPVWQLLGRGWRHAFGVADYPSQIADEVAARVVPDDPEAGREVIADVIDGLILAGQTVDGVPVPAYIRDEYSTNFESFLGQFRSAADQLDPSSEESLLFASVFLNIQQPFAETLVACGLDPVTTIESLGRERLEALIDSMPTQSAELHLRRQFLRNRALRSRRTDLNDWGALIPASMYCDLLVCEKHFADLVRRDGFSKKAVVIRRLAELPEHLI